MTIHILLNLSLLTTTTLRKKKEKNEEEEKRKKKKKPQKAEKRGNKKKCNKAAIFTEGNLLAGSNGHADFISLDEESILTSPAK